MGELVEARGGGRIAVDADQLALGPEPVGDQARVPAAAERAVDDRLTGARIEQIDQLGGKDWDVIGGHVGEGKHGFTSRY